MMTRKDYQALANILKAARARADHAETEDIGNAEYGLIDSIQRDVEEWLTWDNPRFDRKRFNAAANFSVVKL